MDGLEDKLEKLKKSFSELKEELIKAEHKDKIKGGLADKKKPKDFDQKQLAAGIKVEMEHTDKRETAQEIAMDHLAEDPDYYKKLSRMESKKEVKKSVLIKALEDAGYRESALLLKTWNKIDVIAEQLEKKLSL